MSFSWASDTIYYAGRETKKKKEMETSGKLCLFEGKMLPISSMMKMYQRCQPDVDMWIFSLRTQHKELSGCSSASEWRCIVRLDGSPGKPQLYLMLKRKRKCVLNGGLGPRFPGRLPAILCYEWARLIAPSQFRPGKSPVGLVHDPVMSL